ncbi:baseplate assembly protein [Peribacillus aracenensis]|uniref:baseplate assembly protein n=1 Tax=Peribacillus aracenensis TaxID=2976708 RepID=UPI0021A6393D|nr:baseplate J/gp47 family protein [Peribacillus sp. BBB004]
MSPRFNLPDIDFAEVDPEELENVGISKFEELMKITLTDSDPRRKWIQAVAYIGTILANNIDYTGKQNLLAYASDNYLEHIGAGKNVSRLQPIAAETTVRFEVSAPETFTIPQGVRLSVNDLLFASAEERVVNPTEITADLRFVCETPGTDGNGFLPGQITNIVDPDLVPWVSKAYNTTKSEGGVNWEEDDPFAERIRTSNERYSTTGPEQAYVYFAKTANQKIIDVKVFSPSPGVVEIVPLLVDGEIPSEAILQQVKDICSDKTVRPLTDYVQVSAPGIFNYDMEISYFLPNSSLAESSKKLIESAFNEYLVWQRSKLGRGIDPSELYARLQNAGAKRISVTPSNYVALNINQVAREGLVSLTFGGFTDD